MRIVDVSSAGFFGFHLAQSLPGDGQPVSGLDGQVLVRNFRRV